MIDNDRITELETKIARLEAVIAQTGVSAETPTPAVSTQTPVFDARTTETEGSSRRHMLRNVALATGGAIVATVGANSFQAAAADGDPILLGEDGRTTGGSPSNNSTSLTHVRYIGATANETGFMFEAGITADGLDNPFPSALAGWTGEVGRPTGVTGVSSIAGSGIGVAGAAAAGTGVFGYGGTGVVGQVPGGPGIGVSGTSPASFGVQGTGATGVSGVGTQYALAASGANGAALFLSSATIAGPARIAPSLRSDGHVAGEIDVDADDNLWVCVADGTPGTWRKVAGPATGGAFHPLTPGRVYDSRAAAPASGTLATGANRTIDVSSLRDLASGAVTRADFVPAGATAISCNVTVADTTGSGFLTINPGGEFAIQAAAINWSAAGQILNNGVILKINAARELTVICGGGGSTNFIIDVTGYYL